MTEELKSKGKCLYCGEMFSQKGISKHLASHLAQMEKKSGENKVKYVHIEIEAFEMFLQLLVRGDTQMKVIDNFLRDIWLDCCGHLSAFSHNNFKVSMRDKVEDVFQPRIKIYHDYDFGTTTRVFLKARKHYQLNLREKIILISRNEPLKIMCSTCKKVPAVNICVACWYDKDAFFCETCSEDHAKECDDFTDYAEMPIVNSPRMGECGYEGGAIDLERDKPFRK